MKRTMVFAACLAACAQALAQAPAGPACVNRDEALPDIAIKTSAVRVISIKPDDGGEVLRTSVIEVDAEYQVAGFKPKEFYLLGMFSKGVLGSMSPNDPGNTPPLAHAHGRAHLCVPVAEVYSSPGMSSPLSMSLEILQMTGNSGTTVTASDTRIKFRQADLSGDEIALQTALPPPEYVDALLTAHGHLESRAASYQRCIRRFPETQPAFTKIYRAWEARHAADIQFIAQRTFEYFSQVEPDNPAVAADMSDSSRKAHDAFLEQKNDADLRRECNFVRDDMTEADDVTNDVIADKLEVIRAWKPGKP